MEDLLQVKKMMDYETEVTTLKITPLDGVPQNQPNHTHQSSWMLSKGLLFVSEYLPKSPGHGHYFCLYVCIVVSSSLPILLCSVFLFMQN